MLSILKNSRERAGYKRKEQSNVPNKAVTYQGRTFIRK
jgi:hypothetical protein